MLERDRGVKRQRERKRKKETEKGKEARGIGTREERSNGRKEGANCVRE